MVSLIVMPQIITQPQMVISDIFLNDTDDTMYKDVTADIDKNTTGAKNRSADSITFSDVDVTKVVQTGEKNFKVTFTGSL